MTTCPLSGIIKTVNSKSVPTSGHIFQQLVNFQPILVLLWAQLLTNTGEVSVAIWQTFTTQGPSINHQLVHNGFLILLADHIVRDVIESRF